MVDVQEKCRVSLSAYKSMHDGTYEQYHILMGFSTKWWAFCWKKGERESTTQIYDGYGGGGYDDGDKLVEELICQGYHFVLGSAREI